jgi:hypothetical protein
LDILVATLAAVLGAWFVESQLLGYFWGLVAAIVATQIPTLQTDPNQEALMGTPWLVIFSVVWAASLSLWRACFEIRLVIWDWFLSILCAGTGLWETLAWRWGYPTAVLHKEWEYAVFVTWLVLGMTSFAIVAGFLLSLTRRLTRKNPRANVGNLLIGGMFGISLVLFVALAWSRLPVALTPPGKNTLAWDRLLWPHRWTVGAFAAFGVWRMGWSGLEQFRRGVAPVAWWLLSMNAVALTCYSLCAHQRHEVPSLPFGLLVLSTVVFGVGDQWRRIVEQVRLRPPE